MNKKLRDGERYIQVDCAKAFKDVIQQRFSEFEWELDGTEFSHYDKMSSFPERIVVRVLNKVSGKTLAIVEIISSPYITQGKYGTRYINMKPVGIVFKEVSDGLVV